MRQQFRPRGPVPPRWFTFWPPRVPIQNGSKPVRENSKLLKTIVAAGLVSVASLGVVSPALAQCGGASWYGPGFDGKRTASGRTFNQNAMTAAHKTLPFGTEVQVTDQRTGKSVTVTINDRGPFHKGRIIDLSKAAATELGFRNRGTTSVCIEQV
jgi:rare lipoprotein A